MNTPKSVFEKQSATQRRLRLTGVPERRAKLEKLLAAIESHADEIRSAIASDFRKSPAEVDLTEILPTVSEIKYALKHLSHWMKPQKVSAPLAMFGTKSLLYHEPKGVSLIIAPWNYPFALLMIPLVSAIAAGCAAVLKPSELTPATSKFIRQFIGSLFSEDEVAVFEGGAEMTQELLKLSFSHVFFTGSTRVGRIVMEAAAKHLSSVTLELGGKSPALIDESTDMADAALKIAWGKFVNGGQTCVAPDYCLVPEKQLSDFVEHLKKSIAQLYGSTREDIENSPDFCRMVNRPRYDHLKKLLEASTHSGAVIETGGQFNDLELFLAPTLLTRVDWQNPIMSEEIFGPILPILTYKNADEALEAISRRDRPLALYVFGKNSEFSEKVLRETSAGGTCINNTLIHLANPNLPFGGIGPSGMGNYHGHYGFKAFSHERAVVIQGRFNSIKNFYPPYTKKVKKLIQTAMRYLA